MQSLTTVSNI